MNRYFQAASRFEAMVLPFPRVGQATPVRHDLLAELLPALLRFEVELGEHLGIRLVDALRTGSLTGSDIRSSQDLIGNLVVGVNGQDLPGV